jgi:hypothetical protein
MHRKDSRVASLIVVFTMLLLVEGSVLAQNQTPGHITQFDSKLNVVDSVITQDPNGNIGVGTMAPAAALDVATGDLNVAGRIQLGGMLFLHNFGTYNTFVGQQSGNLLMTGFGNTAAGVNALEFNTSGSVNTASGYSALSSNTTGDYNTASGFNALSSNTTGGANTATGGNALRYNTSGGVNTAIGFDTLISNTTGDSNTASGFSALSFNTTGGANTATGVNALEFNTSGRRNTASGFYALVSNTTGYDNTALGAFANVSFADLNNATAIGANAVVDASNKIRLGDANVTVIEGQVPYTFTSDRNQKERFRSVDGEDVLRKLAGLNLTSWNYIGHDPQQFRHYGPVAQEFFAAFGHDGVGTIGTPTTLNSGDMEGILMIAVQALEKRTAENAELKARIEALERLVKGAATDGGQPAR